MATNKRITDLTDYTSVLPYASELFGVYQPLIGWKSKRIMRRMNKGIHTGDMSKFKSVLEKYKGEVSANFDGCIIGMESYRIGAENNNRLKPQSESILLSAISDRLNETNRVPENERWSEFINPNLLQQMLNEQVFDFYKKSYEEQCPRLFRVHQVDSRELQLEIIQALKTESAIAGALLGYVENRLYEKLKSIFYFFTDPLKPSLENIFDSLKDGDYKDPYLLFDPKKDIKDVSLSPVGVVHLYRQYFFELDTFLGTPVSHVWLSPGSSVELIETSSRKTTTEKVIETSLETMTKTESSTTDESEISEAVKRDNRDDMKLGFSATVNQSWPTGSASATGSLNMDKTQQVARDNVEKRSHQQTTKLATEIRQNFKSTFKTITEVTDTSSKRYVLNNTTLDLINYELRRKMRQVGVQIQDVGSYLCWETFVDEPGLQLGLPDLIHIAQPADLIIVPNPKLTTMPALSLTVGFSGDMEWFFPENQRQHNGPDGFYKMNTLGIPPLPDGYELDVKNDAFDIGQEVVIMEDDDSEFFKNIRARGKVTPDGLYIEVGLVLGGGGLAWDEGRIRFKVNGSVRCKLRKDRIDDITKANDAVISAKLLADAENSRKQEEAYRKAAQERVTLASKIKKRKFEDLREEERTIVYRNLIKSLMTESHYRTPASSSGRYETQHVLSELINSIFDIDKMLYFVAPEWWKSRERKNRLSIGNTAITNSINDSLVRWTDQQSRPDNYFITSESEPAALGSSLGWLLQLDGDDLRNAFLNAPWVKAVIPIRPGKEQAAITWLQNVGVEGSDGLDAIYSAPNDELVRINVYLNTGKVPRQFSDADWEDIAGATAPNPVTIRQALEFLCAEVSHKDEVSKTVSKYPKEEIDDDNKVLATPIEKVYEHGFYPLKGGFKAIVEDYFETISQWVEVLPTDQVVPVEVKYDPEDRTANLAMGFINPIIPLNDVKPINALTMSSSGGNIPIADYIDCIKKVQAGFPQASPLQVVGSIRNLYYSGPKFYYLIPRSVFITQPINTESPESIESPTTPVDQLPKWQDKKTLEKLKVRASENGQEDNPSPYLEIVNNGKTELIDVGHLLLTLDALQHSTTAAPYATFNIPNIDISSWIADVAIAAYWHDFRGKNGLSKLIADADFVEIEGRDKDALRKKMLSKPSGPTDEDFFDYSAPESDLLGDIDGFVMNHLYASTPNSSLSQLFHLYYANPSGKFIDKRFWFFCFLNQMNYSYGKKDWADINSIYNTYLPRIDRCVDLFYSGAFGAAGNFIKSPISNPGKNTYAASKIYLQQFLDWLKPRLQGELAKVQGNLTPNSGNMFP